MNEIPLAFVIEDYPDTATVFQKALEMAGYRVQVFLDGAEAQQALFQSAPVLIVLDLHIPTIDGGSLLQFIRNDPRLASVRVILATADALMAEKLGAQADLVLLKPISFSQLAQLAERLYYHHPK